MATKPRVVALLFGRAGSVGLPGKNVKMILGRPSPHYPLLAAQASGIVDDIYVSTDSEEIFSIARPFGVKEIHRPAELASNAALLEDAIYHAFEFTERDAAPDSPVDYYLILLCNSVTVIADRVREAYEMLRADPEADSVTTAGKWNMFSPVRARRRDPDGRPASNCHDQLRSRQIGRLLLLRQLIHAREKRVAPPPLPKPRAVPMDG
jgi:CMP-N-acetylneuraminic acid synthetase